MFETIVIIVAVLVTLFFALCAVSACVLSSKISQAEELAERLKYYVEEENESVT